MFHPVGPKRPAVYWRRRVVLAGSVVLLLVLLITVVRGTSSRSAAAPAASSSSQGTPRPAPAPARRSATSPPTSAAASTAASSSTATAGTSTAGASAPSSSPPPRPCTARDLAVAALPVQSHYAVGSKPLLGLEVTDVGPAPCVQDLSDQQVLLQVYDGATRVWGSHDCGTQPGTDLRTLTRGRPVHIELAWSGTTSAPGCGSRQQVGAGSYTLYASVSGRNGTAASFTLS